MGDLLLCQPLTQLRVFQQEAGDIMDAADVLAGLSAAELDGSGQRLDQPMFSWMICWAWRSSSDCWRSTTLPSRLRAWNSSTTELTRRRTT